MNVYDHILAGIPLSMIAGGISGAFTPLPLNLTIAAGGLVSLGLMYHGMFRYSPV